MAVYSKLDCLLNEPLCVICAGSVGTRIDSMGLAIVRALMLHASAITRVTKDFSEGSCLDTNKMSILGFNCLSEHNYVVL